MTFRWFPKLVLWLMLLIACLGTVSTLLQTDTDPDHNVMKRVQEQQMAIHIALAFTREWMDWNGAEKAEERTRRLQPYVPPEALGQIATVEPEQETDKQDVVAVDFVSLSGTGPRYTVQVRVITSIPERAVWELDVPVWVKGDQQAVVTAPPVIRPTSSPPRQAPEKTAEVPATPREVEKRMHPAMESFLRAICEGESPDDLSNYVTSDAGLLTLGGKLHFLALERLDSRGTGPYTVTVTFSVRDPASGFQFTQVWTLSVTEENGKFFVGDISA